MKVIDTAFWDFGMAIRLAHLPVFRFEIGIWGYITIWLVVHLDTILALEHIS